MTDKIKFDPFNDFGWGIKSYFILMRMLMWLFIVLSIMFTPTMYIYYQGGAFDFIDKNLLDSMVSKVTIDFSLGNLGHAQAVCDHQYLAVDKETKHQCHKGKMTELKQMGILPSLFKNQTGYTDEQKNSDFVNDFCDSPSKNVKVNECTQKYLKKNALINDYKKCIGKTNCILNLSNYFDNEKYQTDKDKFSK